MTGFADAHRETLERAIQAIAVRDYWSAYPEIPSGKIYGETAKADAEAAFEARLGQPFALPGHPEEGRVGAERSPYGFELGITYPRAGTETLVAAAQAAGAGWAAATLDERAGVCLEILLRLNRRSFEIADAVMHTTGQAFVMAFQAGGPHAQDRGLEAVAYAVAAMRRVPAEVVWEKPQGKQPPLRVHKTFRLVPRGIGLVVACSTFPTWNSYSGLFADLVAGCPVIVKPHPGAVLPLALTVEVARAVLTEAGFDPNVALLAADDPTAPVAQDLVRHLTVQLIDYTGGPGFGEWIKANAPGKQVFTEQAGVNSVVIDSTADFAGLCRNLAFSLCLYSGQMCTAPQNVYVPKAGIDTDQGHKSFEEVVQALATAVQKLLGDPERAEAVLGAIQNDATLARLESAGECGEVVLASRRVEIPGFPEARAATPAIVKAAAATGPQDDECFGPVSFVVPTADTGESLRVATDLARRKGAITALVHSTDEDVLARAADLFAAAGVSLAVNLTGGLFVNQNAAFSDFHVSGANPAGTATLVDEAFVTPRFRVVATRREVPAT